jgi:hypothetical protein
MSLKVDMNKYTKYKYPPLCEGFVKPSFFLKKFSSI